MAMALLKCSYVDPEGDGDPCGAPLTVYYDPGEPAITSGPPDYWHPGAGPSLEDCDPCMHGHDHTDQDWDDLSRQLDAEGPPEPPDYEPDFD